jgi:hypothetical protein
MSIQSGGPFAEPSEVVGHKGAYTDSDDDRYGLVWECDDDCQADHSTDDVQSGRGS